MADPTDPFDQMNEFAEAIALYKGPKSNNVKAITLMMEQAVEWSEPRGIDLMAVLENVLARRAG